MFEPFGTSGTNLSAHWHPEPRGRGTFNILSTCLTTMILCVWTAVHLNIPDHNGGTRQKFLRKPGWLLLALLAPEIIAWNAWEQRKTAQLLMKAFIHTFRPGQRSPPGWIGRTWRTMKRYLTNSKEIDLDPEQGSRSDSRSEITMVHGFYAAMGGFAISSHFLDTQYPLTGQGRLTLAKESIFILLRKFPEVFPDIDAAEILDKSKASTLVKTLTCLQALWFCLQCILRLTMNSSITLLELNVFGHCICTFIIYALWWNKPMDISEPTLIRVEKPEIQSLIALLCSQTTKTVPRLPHPLSTCVVKGHEYKRITPRLVSYIDSELYGTISRNTQFDKTDSLLDRVTNLHGFGPIVFNGEKQVEECAGLCIERLKQLLNLSDSGSHIKVSMFEDAAEPNIRIAIGSELFGLTYYLSRVKLEQLSPGLKEVEHLENNTSIFTTTDETPAVGYHLERSYFIWLQERFYQRVHMNHLSPLPISSPFVDRIHDWTLRSDKVSELSLFVNHFWAWGDFSTGFQSNLSLFPQLSAISVASFAYGGLHLLAWNAPFQTPIYGILWKISGIAIAGLGIILLLTRFVHFMNRVSFDSKHHESLMICLMLISIALLCLATLCLALLYVCARVYLVVESFLSLAYLPDSALTTPKFSLYFPHIG